MKLSIIIPIYNVEKFLSHCLDSVIYNNTELDYEIIAVNDGSTDTCPNILDSYVLKYPKLIRRVDKVNGGLGSARNAGLGIARGEYVIFLDSDDYLAENAIIQIIDIIDNNSFDICFFDQVFYNENGQEIMRYKGSEQYGSFSFESYPQILFQTPNAGNKIFRTSLFCDNGISFPPRQWFEDINSIYLLYPHANRMIYIPEGWNCHLQRSGSITNSKNADRNVEMISAAEDLLDYYSKLNLVSDELEYCIFYNELLTSVDRVNLIDKTSAVQNMLLDWFLEHFPDYKDNKYIKGMPLKHKLLFKLILTRHYGLLNLILKFNAKRYE